MSTSTSFEAAYLHPSGATYLKSAGTRGQVAGVLNALRRQLSDGVLAGSAHAITDQPWRLEILDRAAREISGVSTLKADYAAIDSL